MDLTLLALKVVVSLGILNVWLLRRDRATAFRGRDATTMREEFAVYGLGYRMYCVVGLLKVALAVALLASIFWPVLEQPAAMGMALLMLVAFVMHQKVRDPLVKALPSLAVLAMCAAIAWR